MSPPIPPTLSQTAASSSSTHDEFWLSLTGDKWESAQDQQMSHSITSLGLPLERVQANTDVSSPYCDPVSPFERIITTYEPIFQTLIAFLPTSSVFNLYHTSRYLRNHLQSYPLAWKSLSFRLPQPTNNSVTPGTNPGDITEWQSKQYALDLVLKRVVVPIALRLTSLDLCNTAISGALLVGSVLEPRKETLRHVSVRGCKNVSLKYHIVPFLHQIKIETKVWGDLRAFALKSLYTYRCRHHRRRPYLPASLARRDSDSEPTHDLIELCHQLGIWTDTAWCPTPGPRCHRRKDYHGNRAAPGTMEVWVPFDRLWRSSNRVGPSDDYSHGRPAVGKLWEEDECGHDGEALGTKDSAIFAGEGKEVPTHMRRSHRTFVEDIKCDDCEEVILERCETCSIRMHCMGCRKTLCASCAFNRPLKKKHKVMGHMEEEAQLGNHEIHSTSDQAERYWWAIGAARSPNIMTDASEDPDSDDESRVPTRVNAPTHPGPLKINMSWCCLEPLFSGGGGVAFVGPGLGGHGSERIRAVPLQQRKEYIDPDFCTDSTNSPDQSFQKFDDRLSSNVDILPYLQQASLDLQSKTCPRCLCKSCYRSFRWKVDCRACKRPICKEHDFRALKARKCGFRDLSDEREYVRNPPKQAREDMIMREAELWPTEMRIPEFRLIKAGESSVGSEASGDDERRPRQAEIENQEWSDAGSSGEGPSTRDPSSTPRALPIPHADRSSSASRGPGSSDEESRAIEPALFFPNLDLVERANIVAQSRPPLRGRSFSMSEIANSKGKGKAKLLVPHLQQTTKTPKEHMLLPCHGRHPVQWQGCGAYFCQGSRSVGDVRQRCFATGKECTECGVYVCQVSLSASNDDGEDY